MSLLRRISTTLSSSVERAVSKVENHDAIIQVALRDTEQAGARARVRLERVRKDGRALKARLEELKLAKARWTDRARSLAAGDETKALECLRRRRDCDNQLSQLIDSIEKHDELEGRIAAQVEKIAARVNEVAQQRNMMRSRQSVADAMRIINNLEGTSYGEVEDTFDRWEINLGETEAILRAHTPFDGFESEFIAEEDATALRAELKALVGGAGEDS